MKKAFPLFKTVCVGLVSAFAVSSINPAWAKTEEGAERLNVVLVMFDDMNDWIEPLSDQPSITPNLSKFAKSSFVFTQASTVSPVCNPSRVAMMTGVRPTTSGVYNNSQVYPKLNHWIASARNLPQHFKDNGYVAAGYGKIFHHRHVEAYEDADHWTQGFYTPWSLESEEALPEQAEMRFEIPALKRHFGRLPDDWDKDDPKKMQQDTLNTVSAIEFLENEHDKPFFLALGIYRPHTHWYAARRYWDKFPREEIELAAGIKDDDLKDVPAFGRMLALSTVGGSNDPADYEDYNNLPDFKSREPFMRPLRHEYLVEHDLYKDAARAYMASIAYADDMFGRLMDALANSEYAENTVVVVVSDHGYHLGEKNHWHKSTMWERSMRIPFMISLPKPFEKGAPLETPVSALDLYPTLTSFLNLSEPAHALEGVDLVPLLTGETKERGQPVVSTLYRGYHSVRDDRFRYIRYPDGSKELYDLEKDPWEWTNLAKQKKYAEKIRELDSYIPQTEEMTIGHAEVSTEGERK